MNKTLVYRLITLVASLFIALILAAVSVVAWFATSTVNEVTGISLTVQEEDGNISIDDVSAIYVDSAYLLSPGNSVTLSLTADTPCINFGINLETVSTSFEATLAQRNDLLIGGYLIAQSVTGQGGVNTQIYSKFDIDEHLQGIVPMLSSSEIQQQKINFYQRFRTDNSIHNVLSVAIIELNGSAVNIPLVKQADTEIYYAATATALNAADTLVLSIVYLNGSNSPASPYIPTITYLTSDEGARYFAPTQSTTYHAENYNCFMGYTINVTFVSQ